MNGITQELSALLSSQLQAGNGSARASFGAKTQAFAWIDGPLNSSVAYVTPGIAESTTFPALKVKQSAEVTAIPDGTQKPVTAVLESVPVTLATYPGVVEVKTSQVIDSANLGAAINQALYAQALAALDKALVTQLLAVPGGITGAGDLDDIATAQATLMGRGFAPDMCIVSPAGYAAIVNGGGNVLTQGGDPQQAFLAIWGSRLLVSSALTAGQTIVLNSGSVMAIEHASSPVALVDTHARTNTVDVVVELVAGLLVTHDLGIVNIKAVAAK